MGEGEVEPEFPRLVEHALDIAREVVVALVDIEVVGAALAELDRPAARGGDRIRFVSKAPRSRAAVRLTPFFVARLTMRISPWSITCRKLNTLSR